MAKPHTKSSGRLLAAFLSGAWRESLAEPSTSAEELSEIAPLLMGSGAGALAWWRIQRSSLSASPAGAELQDAYRLHTLHALIYKQKIKRALSTLRAASIEPILIKGWANARLYPEEALRPYGDVDLCVSPEDYEAAAELMLARPEGRECTVDLHKALGRLDGRSWEEFYARSQTVNLDDVSVRLLSPEDHLHILCVHMLEDGAWRPIQLCDIAVAVEGIDSGFDWDVCLGKDKRRAKWVACAIALAHSILGARPLYWPAEVRDARTPRWLVPTLLRHWEKPCLEDHRPPELIMKTLRKPSRVPKALILRWPDPIGATIRLKGSFNQAPRLPFQIGDYIIKNGKFLMRLPRWIKSAVME